jgi:tetraacyldisaccharide 4'-kinase
MRGIRVLASKVYGLLVAVRGMLYDTGLLRSYDSHLAVISVGNVTAGGNGKTPLCIFLAEELAARGYRPAVLSRGYGGRLRGPHRVAKEDSPRDVGDEPLLLAQSGVDAFIARSRVEGVKYLEALREHSVVILDDGFQHRALNRNIDIVSIFGGSEGAVRDFIRGELLPAGMFRERRDRALARASIVVVANRTVVDQGVGVSIDPRLLRLLPAASRVFSSHLEARGVFTLEGRGPLPPQLVHGCTAIANPEGFFRSLRTLGYQVAKTVTFPDHHNFTADEIAAILDSSATGFFVCTPKDAVKLARLPVKLRERFAVLETRAVITPHDEFLAEIERLLEIKRGDRG